ncbi:hypothetical protein AB0B63_18530 [Micromonospora sp. NPDC049081]|uniref:hypothetical protein n=1 Tax=Micromonospora sp. NPDC049081 TaxID=3155150 RepID=UPI0033FEF08C
MKAITIREPYASCIAAGAKLIENRASGTTYRGPLLIHTSQQIDRPACNNNLIRRTLWGRTDYTDTATGYMIGDFNFGQVIAVADLVDVHDAETIPVLTGEPGTCCEPWGQRLHGSRTAKHLVLANVRRLRQPVHARGALGLWTPTDDVIACVDLETTRAGAR